MRKTGAFRLPGQVYIVAATLIWGTTFAAQSIGMDYIGPLTFTGARFFVGGCVILALKLLTGGLKKNAAGSPSPAVTFRRVNSPVLAGIMCGAVLFVSCILQQYGILYTTIGKAGFITSLYVVIVPLIAFALGKKPGIRMWLGVALAVAGMYFLCIGDTFEINAGDMLVMACAVCFAVQILMIDHFSPCFDGLTLAYSQFFTVSVISMICAFFVEKPTLSDIASCAGPILYAGVLSCGVAYTLQIMAQKSIDPSLASLLFTLESVFAAITGFVILHERLSPKELAGCALMLIAVIAAQLPNPPSFLKAKKQRTLS